MISYTLRDDYIQAYPFFQIFDKDHFFSHTLKDEAISYRNDPSKTVEGKVLNKLIEELIEELKTKRTYPISTLTNFIILKQRDYDPASCTGLIIVKFKDYPFVVKLFIKTPQTLALPFFESFESNIFYIMGGGVNRFFSGFTRIKNLDAIRKRIATSPYWSRVLDTPRKWFWYSPKARWLDITGKNIGNKPYQHIEIPATYGLICDAIESDALFSLWDNDQCSLALKLCDFFQSRIDAHIDNYMYEKQTGLMLIVDSEHFPSMVGLRSPMKYTSYWSWFAQLSWKCFSDKCLQSKSQRRRLQQDLEPVLGYTITD
ncbi:MAG TPA: hypothetical protein VHA52_08435 [Candidatus Babeliaceae bacterium]|nr:hypothetical protein [Candidatus Babeliaceae bacterium]